MLEAGWLAIALLVPLVLLPTLKDAFELPKLAVFRLCLYGSLVVAAALAIVQGRSLPRARALRDPRTQMAAAAAVVVAVLALATVFSAAPIVSFWGGHAPSSGGLRSMAGYALLFGVVALYLRTASQLRRLCITVAGAATLSAGYGAVQALGLDPFRWANASADIINAADRVASTMGNPNFIGGYLALALFPTLGLALAASTTAGRAGWGAAAALQLLTILWSQTRTAWIGIVVGAGALAILITAQRGGPWRRMLGVAAGALVLSAAGLWLVAPYLPETGPLARLAGIARPTEGSGGIRIAIWGIAADLWRRRPLLGWGPDSFESVAEMAFRPGTEALLRGSGLARAENGILETVDATGALGLAALALVTLLPLSYALRALPRTRNVLLPALLAGAATHLVAQQALITETAVATLAALVWGALAGYSITVLDHGTTAPNGAANGRWEQGPAGGGAAWRAPVAFGAAAVAIVTLCWLEGRQIAGSAAFTEATAYSAANRSAEAVASLERSSAVWPYDYQVYATLARERRSAAASLPANAQARVYGESLRAAERAMQIDPAHPLTLTEWAAAAGELAVATNDAALAERARSAFAQVHAIAPYASYPWKMSGAMELRANRPAAARDDLRQATTIFRRDWQAWVLLGQALQGAGDATGARDAFREALRCAPNQGTLRQELEQLGGGKPTPDPTFSCTG